MNMDLEELAGKSYPTKNGDSLDASQRMFEIEVHDKKNGSYVSGNAILLTQDGWLMTADHILKPYLHDPNKEIKIFDIRGEYQIDVDTYTSSKDFDMAMIRLENYLRKPFSYEFSEVQKDENILIPSLMKRNTLISWGTAYFPSVEYVCPDVKKQVKGMICKAGLGDGQSGSMILNEQGAIVGMATHSAHDVPVQKGSSKFTYGVRVSDMHKFIRKVYRKFKK